MHCASLLPAYHACTAPRFSPPLSPPSNSFLPASPTSSHPPRLDRATPKNRDVLQSRQPALQLLDLGVQEEELVELEGLHDGAGGVARLWPTTPLVELEGLHAFLEGLHAFGSPAEWSAFVEQVAGKKARASSVLDFPFADNQLKRG